MTSTLFFLLLVLACPIGMWLMMRGGHGGHGMHGQRPSASVDDLRRQREQLDREIASREGR